MAKARTFTDEEIEELETKGGARTFTDEEVEALEAGQSSQQPAEASLTEPQGPPSLLDHVRENPANRFLYRNITKPLNDAGQATWDGIKAIPGMISSPIETAKQVGTAVAENPGATAGAFGAAALSTVFPPAAPLLLPVALGIGTTAGQTADDIMQGRETTIEGTGQRFIQNTAMAGSGVAGDQVRALTLSSRPAQAVARGVRNTFTRPATDEQSLRAMRLAGEEGIELNPGQKGSRVGTRVEADEFNDLVKGNAARDRLRAQQDQIEDVAGRKLGQSDDFYEAAQRVQGKASEALGKAPAPHELGVEINAARQAYRDNIRAQENIDYSDVRAMETTNAIDKSLAAKGVDARARGILERSRLIERVDVPGTQTTVQDILGQPRLVDNPPTVTERMLPPGSKNTAIDSRVLSEIQKLRNDPDFAGGKPSYAALNEARQAFAKLLDDGDALGFNGQSMAATQEMYGALKDAQRKYLTPEGQKLLAAADARAVQARELVKQVAQLPQDQNILKIFENKSAANVQALDKMLKQSGATVSVEELRRAYVIDAAENAGNVAAFDRKISRLGSGVRDQYFNGADVQKARNMVLLEEVFGKERLGRMFRGNNADTLGQVQKALESIGEGKLFDAAKKQYLRELSDGSGNLTVLNNKLKSNRNEFGPGVYSKYFVDDPNTEIARDVTSLRAVADRSLDLSQRAGGPQYDSARSGIIQEARKIMRRGIYELESPTAQRLMVRTPTPAEIMTGQAPRLDMQAPKEWPNMRWPEKPNLPDGLRRR